VPAHWLPLATLPRWLCRSIARSQPLAPLHRTRLTAV
jgi:hypothetical protein